MYIYSDRVDFTEVAQGILPEGYAHASGNGQYTVDKRQFYYAVRDQFLEKTGREITADYFSQTLLVKYMNQNPEETSHWKITASPRGTLSIANTGYDLASPAGLPPSKSICKKPARCAIHLTTLRTSGSMLNGRPLLKVKDTKVFSTSKKKASSPSFGKRTLRTASTWRSLAAKGNRW